VLLKLQATYNCIFNENPCKLFFCFIKIISFNICLQFIWKVEYSLNISVFLGHVQMVCDEEKV
jgi:hypothetical protein